MPNLISIISAALQLLLLLGSRGAHATPAPPLSAALDRRQTTGKYCNATSNICYLQYSWGATIPVFRVAVPDSASTGAPFDTLLQIVAPTSLGWAGFAWGGGMTLDPLTVVWPNGRGGVTVSSRWATSRSQPALYSSATYRTLWTTHNSTHWTVEAVCSGCSQWSGGRLSSTGVNSFAWAVSHTNVAQPASTGSSFSVHDDVGMFSSSLAAGKVPKATWDSYINRR